MTFTLSTTAEVRRDGSSDAGIDSDSGHPELGSMRPAVVASQISRAPRACSFELRATQAYLPLMRARCWLRPTSRQPCSHESLREIRRRDQVEQRFREPVNLDRWERFVLSLDGLPRLDRPHGGVKEGFRGAGLYANHVFSPLHSHCCDLDAFRMRLAGGPIHPARKRLGLFCLCNSYIRESL
jgi:hypothetical protein